MCSRLPCVDDARKLDGFPGVSAADSSVVDRVALTDKWSRASSVEDPWCGRDSQVTLNRPSKSRHDQKLSSPTNPARAD